MARARDAGAAVVEFALISVLLVLLLFGVLQVGVYFYARNIVEASAADAARYAASAGVPASAGGARAEQVIARALGARRPRRSPAPVGSAPTPHPVCRLTTVHCTGRIRTLLVAVDIPMRVDVTSSALKEVSP